MGVQFKVGRGTFGWNFLFGGRPLCSIGAPIPGGGGGGGAPIPGGGGGGGGEPPLSFESFAFVGVSVDVSVVEVVVLGVDAKSCDKMLFYLKKREQMNK